MLSCIRSLARNVATAANGRSIAADTGLSREAVTGLLFESLLAAVSSIDLERAGAPAFMAVVTATGRYAYRRDDDVCVVPLSTLAP